MSYFLIEILADLSPVVKSCFIYLVLLHCRLCLFELFEFNTLFFVRQSLFVLLQRVHFINSVFKMKYVVYEWKSRVNFEPVFVNTLLVLVQSLQFVNAELKMNNRE